MSRAFSKVYFTMPRCVCYAIGFYCLVFNIYFSWGGCVTHGFCVPDNCRNIIFSFCQMQKFLFNDLFDTSTSLNRWERHVAPFHVFTCSLPEMQKYREIIMRNVFLKKQPMRGIPSKIVWCRCHYDTSLFRSKISARFVSLNKQCRTCPIVTWCVD